MSGRVEVVNALPHLRAFMSKSFCCPYLTGGLLFVQGSPLAKQFKLQEENCFPAVKANPALYSTMGSPCEVSPVGDGSTTTISVSSITAFYSSL